MDTVDQLLAIEEIKKLKGRYFRALDAKDWDAFANVFAPDAVQDLRHDPNMDLIPDSNSTTTSGAGLNEGNEAIAKWVAWCIGDASTAHHGMMPEIEITSETTAEGVWAMSDYLRFPGQGPEEAIRGMGYYTESYVKLDGGWRIARSAITRLANVQAGSVSASSDG